MQHRAPDYSDSYQGRFRPDTDPVTAATLGHAFFGADPAWIGWLFTLRNRIVSLFGLKTPGTKREEQLRQFRGMPGEQVGLFRVYEAGDNLLVIGGNGQTSRLPGKPGCSRQGACERYEKPGHYHRCIFPQPNGALVFCTGKTDAPYHRTRYTAKHAPQAGYAVYCICITAQAMPPATSIIIRPRAALISAVSRPGRPVSFPFDQPVTQRQHSAQHKGAARDTAKD